MPFITEELWSWLPAARGFLATSAYPVLRGRAPFAPEAERFGRVMEIVQVLRNLRSDLGVAPGRRGRAVLRAESEAEAEELRADAFLVALLAKLEEIAVVRGGDDPHPAGVGVVGTVEVFLPMAGLVDIERERQRLASELSKVEEWLAGSRKKLANPGFVDNAPADVVQRQRDLLAENEARAQTLTERLAALD
jgi:valyl-tRNA synthetase